MDIKVKLTIFGVILIIMLVAFGRNPIEENREAREREKAAKGGDPLIQAIEEHNNKRYKGFGNGKSILDFSGSDGRNNNNFSGRPSYIPPRNPQQDSNMGYPGENTTPNYMRRDGGNTPSSYVPGYPNQYPNQYPTDRINEPQTSQQQPTANPNQGYYPPPPTPTGTKPALPPRSFKGPTLEDGKQLTFIGTRVYTKNSQGKTIPMPDGTYRTKEGMELVVEAGQKIIISN